MLFLILFVVIVIAVVWWLNGQRVMSRNEWLYLKRRGYEAPSEAEPAARTVSKDAYLFSLIESLSDISPFARQRAAEDLSRMCVEGNRDPRMLPSLIVALDDSDASVRRAVVTALALLTDPSSVEALKRRMDVEESIQVRVSLEHALAKLGG
jgi:hypothetical protein